METTASIRKHPVHPILIAFPIGLWIFSLVCDIIYFLGGGGEWENVALYTLAGGIITAIMAAIPGIIDLASITEPKLRRIGIAHMVINLAVVVLYVINFALRRESGSGNLLPFILSLIGVALLGVSGWLGGELVHVYGVGVAAANEGGRASKM